MASARRTAGNAASMLTSDVANRATTFVLYALVARSLGAFAFGQMSLALTLFYTFQVLAVAGLKTLITREIARDRTKTHQYLVNGSLVVVAASLVSMLLLLVFVWSMGYAADTASIIVLLALGLLPYSLSAVCEAVFQAWEQMQYIVYANAPVHVAKVGLAALALALGYGLYHLVILLLASYVAIACIEWWLLLRHITRPRLGADLRFSVEMLRSTGAFLGIDAIIACMSSLAIVLLSILAGETAVGHYSAATQLMVPVTLVYQNIALSVFPTMCRRFEPGSQSLSRITEYVTGSLLIFAVPIVIGLFVLAEPALALLYGGEQFLQASIPLRIMVWNLILIAITSVFGQVLLASLREKVTLRIVVVDALATLILGLVLISRFGVVGAALTMLLVRVIDCCQHYVPVSRLLPTMSLARLAWKPAVAGGAMAASLALAGGRPGALSIVAAGALYGAVLLALAIWSSGGLRQFRARYTYLWAAGIGREDARSGEISHR